MSIQYQKVKSVAKEITVKGARLDRLILETVHVVSNVVGGTLGPGGCPVLIERQEPGLPPIITKDGISVFRSLGFQDSSAHCVMEMMRDASLRTASEAGDGPQPLWSKVLTPSGFVSMQEVKVGMDICGTDGSVQKVLGVFPKGKKEIVSITFADGQAVDCCEDHLWTVSTPSAETKTMSTREMMENWTSEYATPKLKGHESNTTIKKIVKTGVHTEMQCIKVSNPDNLYITDDFVVTHNTTTSAVLAEAIIRKTKEYREANPRVSPQKIVRRLQSTFKNSIEPLIKGLSIPCNLESFNGLKALHAVATVSANGDTDLADAVMKCFNLVGDGGNVTISEVSGPSSYEVEKIDGYPVGVGFEDSCAKYYSKFINDPGTQRCIMDNPVFLVYNGRVTEMQTIVNLLMKVGIAWGKQEYSHHNVVVVATGFSETVLSQLGLNFEESNTINVFPLLAPHSPVLNGQLNFLYDICAITGATLLDSMNRPVDHAELVDLGPGIKSFEAHRFRSNIIGHASGEILNPTDDEVGQLTEENPVPTYEQRTMIYLDHLQTQLDNPASELDKMLLQERFGKITGGIAKLKVVGASNGELKEKRDRAEDAVCAVRGAMQHGCLPGGGWVLLKTISVLKELNDPIVNEVLVPALIEPVIRMLSNMGIDLDSEFQSILGPVLEGIAANKAIVYDILEGKHVEAVEGGILDSLPAVLEAVRNSISIASVLGTLGALVVFPRDGETERSEARDTADFLRNSQLDINDERQ